MKGQPSLRWSGIVLALTLILAACDSDSTDNGSVAESNEAGSEALAPTSLRWNYVIDESVAPYALAAAPGGAYEQAGFDVEVLPGRGSLVAVQTVATGRDDYAIITADAAIQAISEGADLKIVAALQRSHPAALIDKTDVEIQSLQDLVDNRAVLISLAGSSYHQALFGIMEEAGISREDVDSR